jgi:hypothetical protein
MARGGRAGLEEGAWQGEGAQGKIMSTGGSLIEVSLHRHPLPTSPQPAIRENVKDRGASKQHHYQQHSTSRVTGSEAVEEDVAKAVSATNRESLAELSELGAQ